MDTLSHLSAILNGIGWLTLISLVWKVARTFGRIDDTISALGSNHIPHLQDSLTRMEAHQSATTDAIRELRNDIRGMK